MWCIVHHSYSITDTLFLAYRSTQQAHTVLVWYARHTPHPMKQSTCCGLRASRWAPNLGGHSFSLQLSYSETLWTPFRKRSTNYCERVTSEVLLYSTVLCSHLPRGRCRPVYPSTWGRVASCSIRATSTRTLVQLYGSATGWYAYSTEFSTVLCARGWGP